MPTPTADSLLDLEREIEADIIDCLRFLEMGRSEALEELRKTRDSAGASGVDAGLRLRETATASLGHVEAVQRELGLLNLSLHDFVLTDELDMEDLPSFDHWRDRVLASLRGAREALEKLEAVGDLEWRSGLEDVWRRFRQRLELVRAQLVTDEHYAAEELESQRGQLRARIVELREEFGNDPDKARERLRRLSMGEETPPELRELGGWIKALWMWQEPQACAVGSGSPELAASPACRPIPSASTPGSSNL